MPVIRLVALQEPLHVALQENGLHNSKLYAGR
jgi:hypothetical protein